MNAARHWTFTVVALAAGLAAGWWPGGVKHQLSNTQAKSAAAYGIPGEKRAGKGEAGGTEAIFEQLATALREEDRQFQGRIDLCRALEQIGPAQIPALLDRADKLPAKYGRELKAALLERWFEADQNGAENWLHARGRISDEIMQIWARTSPQSALREMFGGSGWYWFAPGVALDLLAGKDFKARLALLASLPPTKNRASIVESELLDWANLEPAKAFQAAETFLRDTDGKRIAEAILKRWAKISPAEAAAKAAELIPPQRAGLFGDDFTTEFARELAQKDPTVAMNFALSLDPSLQEYPLLAATAGWAKADPVAALAWGYENGLDLAKNVRTSNDYTNESVLSEALGKDPEAAAQWLLGLPPDAQRDHLLAQACLLQADAASPEQAMTASGTTLAELYGNLSPSEQAQVATELGARVAKDGDFPDLAAWTARFGNGPARAAAIGGAMAKVFEDSPPLADKIIAGLPNGADRDQAIMSIMNSVSEPIADAAQRALLIGNETTRRDALDQLVAGWIRWDAEACRAWIAAAKDVPSDWVTAWLKQTSAKN